ARGPPDRGDDPGPVGGHLDDERRRHAEGAGPGRDAARDMEGASPAEPVRRQDRVRGVADDRAAPAGDRARPPVGGPERGLELSGRTGTGERRGMAQAATVAEAQRPGPAGIELPGGYAGRLLRVDLSAGRTRSEPWSPADMRTYLGGAGLGAK